MNCWLRLSLGPCLAAVLTMLTGMMYHVSGIRPDARHLIPAAATTAGAGLAKLPGTTQFAIDYIDDGYPINLSVEHTVLPSIVAGQPVLVGGWAVDAAANGPAGGVTILVDGRRPVPAAYGQPRPDVARALHKSRWANSGFTATIATGSLSAGLHVLSFRVVAAGGNGYYQLPARIGIGVVQSVNLAAFHRLTIAPVLAVDYLHGQALVTLARPHATATVRRGQTLEVGGWAVDSRTRTLARGVIITVDRHENLLATYGTNRADVARYYQRPGYAHSGFLGLVPTGYLSPGRHSLTVDVLAAGGKGYYASRASIPFVVR